MQKCLIVISNPLANYKDYREFDSAIEKILRDQYGSDFSFTFDVWWRQSCIDYRARNYPLNNQPWDQTSKSSTSIWETAGPIEEFVDYFFNHSMFQAYKNALELQGWKIQGPLLEQ